MKLPSPTPLHGCKLLHPAVSDTPMVAIPGSLGPAMAERVAVGAGSCRSAQKNQIRSKVHLTRV